MRPYFAGNTLLTLLFAATMLVWLVAEARQALRRRSDASPSDRNSLLVLRISIAVASLLAGLALGRVRAASVEDGELLFYVGLALMWIGHGLRFWSFHALGRYFTFTVMTSPDQRVVTTGPYRILRHPSYLGLILILTGLGATFGNWLSLASLALIPLVGLIYRIRVEEAALSNALGSAYTTYATSRKRLIPFVW